MVDNFPSEIRITPKVSYEIIWNTNLGNGDHLGQCRYYSKQIALQTGRSKKETMQTFLHELAHAVSEEYKLNLSHKAVYGLEKAIYNVLKLNGWLPGE